MLETRQEQVVDLQSVVGGLSADTSVVNTEVEVLRSRSLLGKVVDRLDLSADPEFNAMLRPPTPLDALKERARALLGGAAPGPDTAAVGAAARARASTVDGLLEALSVRNVPQSLVFEVTVESTAPAKAARIADAIVDLYIVDQLETKFEKTEQATSWLTERVTELQVALEAAEAEVKAFRADTELVSPERLGALERQLKELRDRTGDTRAAGAAARDRLAAFTAAETPAAQAAAADDPQLSRFLPRIDEPEMARAFETRAAQIESRLETDASRTGSQVAALEASAEELAGQIDRQSADLIELQQLTREAEASRLLYEYFLSRLKETAAQQGIQQADSRVLSSAVVPVSAAAPQPSLILAAAGLLGLMAGSALVLWREVRNDTFRTAQGLERSTGHAVMGQIPMLPARRRRDAVRYLSEKPSSAAAEAIRNLRTSIMLSNVDAPPQVIMTCSSLPGEGKTTMAVALAQNFASMGKRVLLVEGDIRRQVFAQYMDGRGGPGLLAAITGEKSLDEVVVRHEEIGADMLLGERSSTNAADLFSSERFAGVIEAARARYDQIIIDTPPVLLVPDARIIAQVADTVTFVVRWDRTLRSQVDEALRMFDSVNQPVGGLVLNQISTRGMRRYGYGGRYGAYGVYGRKYYAN